MNIFQSFQRLAIFQGPQLSVPKSSKTRSKTNDLGFKPITFRFVYMLAIAEFHSSVHPKEKDIKNFLHFVVASKCHEWLVIFAHAWQRLSFPTKNFSIVASLRHFANPFFLKCRQKNRFDSKNDMRGSLSVFVQWLS